MGSRVIRFAPGNTVPAGYYRNVTTGAVRRFDGSTPLPGSVNGSSWQPASSPLAPVGGRRQLPQRATTAPPAPHPVRFAAGTMVSPGEYRSCSSGAIRYFDGTTPLPGGVNGSSWQQVSDHFHVSESPGAPVRHTMPDRPAHAVRFAPGTLVSPGLYRNRNGARRYFDGTTPLPGGVNATSWQQVSDHYHPPVPEPPSPRIFLGPTATATPAATAAPVATATPVATLVAPPRPLSAEDLAVELLRRLDAGDDEALTELFTPEAHLYFPLDGVLLCHRGPIQLRKFVAWLRANLPSPTVSIEQISSGAAGTVTVDFETQGRSATGAEFDRTGVLLVEADRGRISLLHLCLGAERA
jgi:hypothetical protein